MQYSRNTSVSSSSRGLPRGLMTSDLWCREVSLEGCAPPPGPAYPEEFRDDVIRLARNRPTFGSKRWQPTKASGQLGVSVHRCRVVMVTPR